MVEAEEHILELLQSAPYFNGVYCCDLCYESGSGPVYHCHPCHFDLHPSCVATHHLDTHFLHPHHPLLLLPLHNRRHSCDLCQAPSSPSMYRCTLCDFDLHSHCIRSRRFIQHPKHQHVLALLQKDPVAPCDCCGRDVGKFAYTCSSCTFNLHPSCAILPHSPLHHKHAQHRLRLLKNAARRSICDECHLVVENWVYQCSSCNYNLHPYCAKLSHHVPQLNKEKEGSTCASTSSVTPSAAESLAPSSSPSCAPETPVPSSNGFCALKAAVTSGNSSLSLRELQEMVRVMMVFVQDYGPLLSSLSSDSPDQEQGTCSICFEDYGSKNPKTKIKCGHCFHYPCILGWYERSNGCPICRKTIRFK